MWDCRSGDGPVSTLSADQPLDAVDPFSERFSLERYDIYRRLREEAPVY